MGINLYVSSLAFPGMKAEEMISIARENDLALEFSSGLSYREDMESVYIHADVKRLPHNYFPAPEIPFVLNLASSNDGIRRKSIEHCKMGLRLAKYSDAPFFAAHAGFCIDPDPQELGRKLDITYGYDKDLHRSFFLESIAEVLRVADDLQVNFLIENNVIAGFNYRDGENPLLCCESSEISWLFENIKHERLGLLLDTAHLKVSCNTLGKKLIEELDLISRYIKGIHHSDNNGDSDDNLSLTREYWFLNYVREFSGIPQVLEVKNLSAMEIKEQFKLLQTVWN